MLPESSRRLASRYFLAACARLSVCASLLSCAAKPAAGAAFILATGGATSATASASAKTALLTIMFFVKAKLPFSIENAARAVGLRVFFFTELQLLILEK